MLAKKNHSSLFSISELVKKATGIELSEENFEMVESRLTQRFLQLHLSSLEDYVHYLIQNIDTEKEKIIGILTTHYTYFFREYVHFEFLMKEALPQLASILEKRTNKTLQVWSAACSKGHEVYSLAMFLDFHLKKINESFQFHILGTDVDQDSIDFCKNGVYTREDLKEVPLSLLSSHWAKGTGEISNFVKAKQSLRKYCHFEKKNLLKSEDFKNIYGPYDLIFCRNVFIYFSEAKMKQITEKLLAQLQKTGYLFIGTSENLSKLALPIKAYGNSIYGHLISKFAEKSLANQKPENKKNIRLVCVDDSTSILILMRKILPKESGFEIVGTACNGIEAKKIIEEQKPDLITLDIHMPEQNGIEYLEKNFSKNHPPVIMVTSVSREDSNLAGRAIQLGAVDYIEKPSLNQLEKKTDELKTKIKAALYASKKNISQAMVLEKAFQKKGTLENPEKKARVLAFPFSLVNQVQKIASSFLDGVPTVFFVESPSAHLTPLEKVLKKIDPNIEILENPPTELRIGQKIALDLHTHAKNLLENALKNKQAVSVLVFGGLSKQANQDLIVYQDHQILLEDTGSSEDNTLLKTVAKDHTPLTSFEYLSWEYLCKSSGKQ